jgi:hypothetical protein
MNMVSLRLVAPLALAGALSVGAATTLSSSAPASAPALAEPAPVAQAGGVDVVVDVYPSVVNTRLVRAEAALDRLRTAVDQRRFADAPVELAAVNQNLAKAWKGARYVIRTAPPPVAEEGSVDYAPTGAPTAGPESTGFAVLSFQHDVVTTSLGLLDGADPSLVAPLRTTILSAIRGRWAAIKYIRSIAPPPATEGRVHATASGAPVVADWAGLMPNLVPMFDDEIQQMNVIVGDVGTESALSNWQDRDQAAQAAVNQTWPAVPVED